MNNRKINSNFEEADMLDLFGNEMETTSQENYDDLQIQLNDIQQSVIWSTDWTCETIVTQIKKGAIDLNPKFQRREAWNDKRKSIFIESIIANLPIPQIILAEKKDRKGSYVVIDGKQRLISLRRFFSCGNNDDFSPLKLKGLTLAKEYEGKTFQDITEHESLSNSTSQIENQPIRTIIIKNWPNDEFLYSVFLRLNTGSLPLATQELRQALHPGPFIDFSDEFSMESSEIMKILGINKPDYRMRDVELVVRYFSFKYYISNYNGNLKRFFDDTVKKLNTEWSDKEKFIRSDAEALNEAIKATYSIFENHAFKKWKNKNFDTRINRAIYDIMVYYFSNEDIRNAAIKKKTQIKEKFISLCTEDNDFLSSFETSTKNIQPTTTRFVSWGNGLKDILGIDIKIPFL